MEMSVTRLDKTNGHVVEYAWVFCQGRPPQSLLSASLLTMNSSKK